jgi:hypothetical protein
MTTQYLWRSHGVSPERRIFFQATSDAVALAAAAELPFARPHDCASSDEASPMVWRLEFPAGGTIEATPITESARRRTAEALGADGAR